MGIRMANASGLDANQGIVGPEWRGLDLAELQGIPRVNESDSFHEKFAVIGC
jgi:hypothetical protein